MAKDPAVLWYFNDWHGGTVTFNRHQKGCYMDLLYAQFNSGHLHIDEIKNVLGVDFEGTWPILNKKFKQDSNGLYFNERLLFESTKRKNYSKSRHDNLNSTEDHMGTHMESVNVTVNKNLNVTVTNRGPEFENAWKQWLEYRKQIKRPYKSQHSIDLQLKKLSRFDDQTAKAMIEQSIEQTWVGIFELKTNNTHINGKPAINKQPAFQPGGAGKL